MVRWTWTNLNNEPEQKQLQFLWIRYYDDTLWLQLPPLPVATIATVSIKFKHLICGTVLRLKTIHLSNCFFQNSNLLKNTNELTYCPQINFTIRWHLLCTIYLQFKHFTPCKKKKTIQFLAFWGTKSMINLISLEMRQEKLNEIINMYFS